MYGRTFLYSCAMVGMVICSAQAQQRVDFWAEAPALFGTAVQGGDIAARTGGKAFVLDYADKKNGDFSVKFRSNGDQAVRCIGFTAGPYQDGWSLDKNSSFHLYLTAAAAGDVAHWPMALIDNQGRRAQKDLTQFAADGQWHEIDLPISGFAAEDGFNFGQIRLCQLEINVPTGTQIWFDDIYWHNPKSGIMIGVTDKTVEQRMAEARKSRSQRVKKVFDNTSASKSLRGAMQLPFAKLWRGEDLDEVNAELLNVFTTKDEDTRVKYRLADHWCLVVNQYMYQMYYHFGSKSKDPARRGRLYPETEKALLAELWDRTKLKNDIAWARTSSWWLTGSENHDMVAKSTNLIASQIFMNEPEYANRILPDLGRGPGSGYWFHQMYAFTTDMGPEGRANWKDGKEYTVKDHFEAWTKFFMDYFAERARKGFFLETSASGYMGVTVSHINDIYDYCQDPALKEQARKFLDLIWAEWTQDELSGVRGGSKTRAGALRAEDAM